MVRLPTDRGGDGAPPHVVDATTRRALSDQASGTLILIGGALQLEGHAFGAFLERTGARRGGLIVVLTAASMNPRQSAAQWSTDFRDAGATNVHLPFFRRGQAARDREIADLIDAARGVFLGGGDQVKLVSTLAGSRTLRAIKQAYRRGGVICGTSAGAAALTELTMAGGEIDEEGNLVEQYIGPGLGLLGFDTIVDTHFSQRRRLQRLFVVVAQNTQLFGLGIDEDTALIVRGHIAEVVGAGGVTFVDGSESVRYDNAGELEKGRQLTLSHLRVGIVGTHHRLDLRARELEVLVRRAEGRRGAAS